MVKVGGLSAAHRAMYSCLCSQAPKVFVFSAHVWVSRLALLASLQTGCAECVWDVYQRELLAYNKELARRKGEPPPLDPFEELERRLFGTEVK